MASILLTLLFALTVSTVFCPAEALKRRSPLHSDVIEEVEAKRLEKLIQETDFIAVLFCKCFPNHTLRSNYSDSISVILCKSVSNKLLPITQLRPDAKPVISYIHFNFCDTVLENDCCKLSNTKKTITSVEVCLLELWPNLRISLNFYTF